jgi:hypothetical protein
VKEMDKEDKLLLRITEVILLFTIVTVALSLGFFMLLTRLFGFNDLLAFVMCSMVSISGGVYMCAATLKVGGGL